MKVLKQRAIVLIFLSIAAFYWIGCKKKSSDSAAPVKPPTLVGVLGKSRWHGKDTYHRTTYDIKGSIALDTTVSLNLHDTTFSIYRFSDSSIAFCDTCLGSRVAIHNATLYTMTWQQGTSDNGRVIIYNSQMDSIDMKTNSAVHYAGIYDNVEEVEYTTY